MRRLKTTQIIGVALILAGIAANKRTLAPLALDGEIGPGYEMLILLLFQLPLVLAGIMFATRPRFSSWPAASNWIFLFASATYSVALAEATIRVFPNTWMFEPRPRAYVGEFQNRQSDHFVADPATGWRMRPNTEFRGRTDGRFSVYRANEEGFRSAWGFSSSERRPKIALVGDSFAFGFGVEIEETFGSLLQSQLGNTVTVWNYAMPGFGLDQMWMSVRHQALPVNPVLVVVAFIDEDLTRTLTAYRTKEGFNKPTFELQNATLRPQTTHDRPNPLIRFFEKYFSLWRGLQIGAEELGYRYRFGDWWLRNEAIFKAIIAECREAGVPVLFVRLPMKQWREFPNVHETMKTERADILDLGNPHARPSYDVHFRTDNHMNEAGHLFVATALRNWIRDRVDMLAIPTSR